MSQAPDPDPYVEERLRKCREELEATDVDRQRLEEQLDELMTSGEMEAIDFEDPSVVRRVEELRERIKRDSKPMVEVPRVRATTRP